MNPAGSPNQKDSGQYPSLERSLGESVIKSLVRIDKSINPHYSSMTLDNRSSPPISRNPSVIRKNIQSCRVSENSLVKRQESEPLPKKRRLLERVDCNDNHSNVDTRSYDSTFVQKERFSPHFSSPKQFESPHVSPEFPANNPYGEEEMPPLIIPEEISDANEAIPTCNGNKTAPADHLSLHQTLTNDSARDSYTPVVADSESNTRPVIENKSLLAKEYEIRVAGESSDQVLHSSHEKNTKSTSLACPLAENEHIKRAPGRVSPMNSSGNRLPKTIKVLEKPTEDFQDILAKACHAVGLDNGMMDISDVQEENGPAKADISLPIRTNGLPYDYEYHKFPNHHPRMELNHPQIPYRYPNANFVHDPRYPMPNKVPINHSGQNKMGYEADSQFYYPYPYTTPYMNQPTSPASISYNPKNISYRNQSYPYTDPYYYQRYSQMASANPPRGYHAQDGHYPRPRPHYRVASADPKQMQMYYRYASKQNNSTSIRPFPPNTHPTVGNPHLRPCRYERPPYPVNTSNYPTAYSNVQEENYSFQTKNSHQQPTKMISAPSITPQVYPPQHPSNNSSVRPSISPPVINDIAPYARIPPMTDTAINNTTFNGIPSNQPNLQPTLRYGSIDGKVQNANLKRNLNINQNIDNQTPSNGITKAVVESESKRHGHFAIERSRQYSYPPYYYNEWKVPTLYPNSENSRGWPEYQTNNQQQPNSIANSYYGAWPRFQKPYAQQEAKNGYYNQMQPAFNHTRHHSQPEGNEYSLFHQQNPSQSVPNNSHQNQIKNTNLQIQNSIEKQGRIQNTCQTSTSTTWAQQSDTTNSFSQSNDSQYVNPAQNSIHPYNVYNQDLYSGNTTTSDINLNGQIQSQGKLPTELPNDVVTSNYSRSTGHPQSSHISYAYQASEENANRVPQVSNLPQPRIVSPVPSSISKNRPLPNTPPSESVQACAEDQRKQRQSCSQAPQTNDIHTSESSCNGQYTPPNFSEQPVNIEMKVEAISPAIDEKQQASPLPDDMTFGPFILNKGYATFVTDNDSTTDPLIAFKQKLHPVIEHLLSIPEAASLRPLRHSPDQLLDHLVRLWGGKDANSTAKDCYERMKENFVSVVKFLFKPHLLSSWGWDKAPAEQILDELLNSSEQADAMVPPEGEVAFAQTRDYTTTELHIHGGHHTVAHSSFRTHLFITAALEYAQLTVPPPPSGFPKTFTRPFHIPSTMHMSTLLKYNKKALGQLLSWTTFENIGRLCTTTPDPRVSPLEDDVFLRPRSYSCSDIPETFTCFDGLGSVKEASVSEESYSLVSSSPDKSGHSILTDSNSTSNIDDSTGVHQNSRLESNTCAPREIIQSENNEMINDYFLPKDSEIHINLSRVEDMIPSILDENLETSLDCDLWTSRLRNSDNSLSKHEPFTCCDNKLSCTLEDCQRSSVCSSDYHKYSDEMSTQNEFSFHGGDCCVERELDRERLKHNHVAGSQNKDILPSEGLAVKIPNGSKDGSSCTTLQTERENESNTEIGKKDEWKELSEDLLELKQAKEHENLSKQVYFDMKESNGENMQEFSTIYENVHSWFRDSSNNKLTFCEHLDEPSQGTPDLTTNTSVTELASDKSGQTSSQLEFQNSEDSNSTHISRANISCTTGDAKITNTISSEINVNTFETDKNNKVEDSITHDTSIVDQDPREGKNPKSNTNNIEVKDSVISFTSSKAPTNFKLVTNESQNTNKKKEIYETEASEENILKWNDKHIGVLNKNHTENTDSVLSKMLENNFEGVDHSIDNPSYSSNSSDDQQRPQTPKKDHDMISIPKIIHSEDLGRKRIDKECQPPLPKSIKLAPEFQMSQTLTIKKSKQLNTEIKRDSKSVDSNNSVFPSKHQSISGPTLSPVMPKRKFMNNMKSDYISIFKQYIANTIFNPELTDEAVSK